MERVGVSVQAVSAGEDQPPGAISKPHQRTARTKVANVRRTNAGNVIQAVEGAKISEVNSIFSRSHARNGDVMAGGRFVENHRLTALLGKRQGRGTSLIAIQDFLQVQNGLG